MCIPGQAFVSQRANCTVLVIIVSIRAICHDNFIRRVKYNQRPTIGLCSLSLPKNCRARLEHGGVHMRSERFPGVVTAQGSTVTLKKNSAVEVQPKL